MVSLAISSCGQTRTQKASQASDAVEQTTVFEPRDIDSGDFSIEIIDYLEEQWRYMGSEPAVIDFYADWCPPCRKLAPVLKELAAQYNGKVKFYKVNVDKEPDLAAAFSVRNLPTLIYIPMNGELKRSVGYMDKDELKKIIDEKLLTE